VQAILGNSSAVSQFHMAARESADANRFEPGTAAFDAAKEATLQERVPNGALFDDKSRFLHFEGQYDFKNEIDVVDLQAGASFRQFQLRSNGTIFDDPDGRNINEFGGYLQASRALGDLRLTGSVRYDKNENFDGQFSPRISAVYGIGASHNLRASYQTGFRNPTTQGQYIDLNVINARLLGGLPYLAERYQITEDSYTIESVQNFTDRSF
jgi:iron complex outermembrane recepter protein